MKKDFKDYISPLYMNGLHGRVLKMPCQNSAIKNPKEILVLPGHNSTIERMQYYCEIFAEYGNVTMPDLPGFGGMDSFYRIGQKPSFDTYSAYLSSFIKLNYKRKKFVIIGFSFSVPIYTRMLQRYTELQKKVEYVVSVSGFVHKEDFRFGKLEYGFTRIATKLIARPVPSFILDKIILSKPVLKLILILAYRTNHISSRHSLKDKGKLKDKIRYEVDNMKVSDFRTSFYTYHQMLTVDLCSDVEEQKEIDLKMYSTMSEDDSYFSKQITEQHLQIVYKEFESLEPSDNMHMPSQVADKSEVEAFIPGSIKLLLSSK